MKIIIKSSKSFVYFEALFQVISPKHVLNWFKHVFECFYSKVRKDKQVKLLNFIVILLHSWPAHNLNDLICRQLSRKKDQQKKKHIKKGTSIVKEQDKTKSTELLRFSDCQSTKRRSASSASEHALSR